MLRSVNAANEFNFLCKGAEKLRQQQSPIKFISTHGVLINPQIGAGCKQHGCGGVPCVHVGRCLNLICAPDRADDLQPRISRQHAVEKGPPIGE